MKELHYISEYLVNYYKITQETIYEVAEVEGYQLLNVNRFDLGAKLYYIRCKVEGKNFSLAKEIYCKHIEAFQDGIIEETGKREKKGISSYYAAFDSLIHSFQVGGYRQNEEWIPVDGNNQIMDGAHRLACAIFFKTKLNIIRFPHINGHKFNADFFRNRGLEQECMRIMATEWSSYCNVTLEQTAQYPILYEDIHYKTVIPNRGIVIFFKESRNTYIPNTLIAEIFFLKRIEAQQVIQTKGWEKMRCRYIRWIRNKYTLVLLFVKKIIKAPI